MTQKLVILPIQTDRDNTPFENAHARTVAAAEANGFSIVEPDDGGATAIVVVRMLDSAIIDQTLAANPAVSWVQLPLPGWNLSFRSQDSIQKYHSPRQRAHSRHRLQNTPSP